jgi:tripartite-type tricarboxylate transporter receptor subunit TctC
MTKREENMNRRHMLASLLTGVALLSAPAFAQEYPQGPIKIIVPFPAGGSSDTVARSVASALEKELGQSVVVENMPGANGRLGATTVAKSKPDGYTLLVASIGVFSINAALFTDMDYDPLTDFDLLTVAVRTPNVLVANPGFAAKTPQELVEQLKANPDTVTFASSGVGSSDHLTAELFWSESGTTGIHVPYQGGGPAIADLVGGHAQVSFQNLGAVSSHIKEGGLKLLATTSEQRLEAFPDAPTMAEAGFPGVTVYSWQAVGAPAGLPENVRAKLESALQTALKSPELTEKFKGMGFEVVGNTGAEFEEFAKAEVARWTKVVQAGGIKPE